MTKHNDSFRSTGAGDPKFGKGWDNIWGANQKTTKKNVDPIEPDKREHIETIREVVYEDLGGD